MNEDRNLSWADIKEMYAETDRRIEKTRQMLAESTTETRQMLAESITETRQFRKESDQRLEKMYAESDARHEKEKKEWNDKYEKEKKKWNDKYEKRKKERNDEYEKQKKERDDEYEKRKKERDDEYEKQKKERNDEHEREKKERKKRNAEYEKRHKEWNENFEKEKQETDKRIANLEKLIGGIGNNNGEMAEEFFFNAFRKDKIFMNEKYDKIKKGYFYSNDPHRGEYDIVFFNGQSVAIVEVKYKAKPNNVGVEILTSRIERLKEYDPEFKNHNFYLGVAAMSFKRGLASKLHNAGIATIHPVGKKMVVYDKTVKAF
jgi:hypothetical protein